VDTGEVVMNEVKRNCRSTPLSGAHDPGAMPMRSKLRHYLQSRSVALSEELQYSRA
jgi:hypothetical protein